MGVSPFQKLPNPCLLYLKAFLIPPREAYKKSSKVFFTLAMLSWSLYAWEEDQARWRGSSLWDRLPRASTRHRRKWSRLRRCEEKAMEEPVEDEDRWRLSQLCEERATYTLCKKISLLVDDTDPPSARRLLQVEPKTWAPICRRPFDLASSLRRPPPCIGGDYSTQIWV